MDLTPDVEKAYQQALKARTHSHSPFSRFKVGASVKIQGQAESVGGCNVENASYGGTICAERVALTSAVARFGRIKPEFMVIVTGEKEATVPCGMCLQVMAEFCGDDFPVYSGNETAILKKCTLKDLLPQAFRQFKPDAK